MTDTTFGSATPAAANSTGRIVMASLVGTAIEFYDFYIYGTAAALVFGPVFFPQESEAAQLLAAFATFAIAFVARPVGSALLGHFGDRVGRKATLVASLLLMGVSTMLIGVLPGYASIGWLAPALLCLMRFGQGLGLGGEWGGAALLAVENAPAGKRGWFGMFPQLGAPIGFLAANGLFLLLALGLDDDQFRAWGWRVPFLLSAVLVAVGLYVRLKLVETPVFREAMKRQERVRVPIGEVLTRYTRVTILGTLAMVSCYALFYITTVFSLGYGTKALGYSRQTFLGLECFAIIFLGLGIPLSSWLSDRIGRRPVLIAGGILTALFGFALAPLLGSGSMLLVTLFLCLGLFLMGLIFGPMGAFLPELFPTRVRYTGASLTYNLAGILGASLAPYIAQTLVDRGGLGWVGGYISIAAVISLVAVWLIRETHDRDLTRVDR
ncbi:MFS transporter [Inquilinus sp. YAF38]|uniref:MFS transporter n=1 Tax=Inquilinus sp. YAF38 TaxID=3233084 RepID=UPI003F91A926